tara:strand:- start:1345 stop:1965 length:621 start_codon:yes stop_codon:yes gene_type:complete
VSRRDWLMNSASSELVVVGIDLSGSSQRPTGVCVLHGLKAVTTLLFGDAEILAKTCTAKPDLVLIDAPLSLPPGRETIHDRNGEHFRPCDRVLQNRGIRFFPATLGPMRMLTERGLQIKEQLDAFGMVSVECYPGGALDVWGLPRQHHDLVGLRRGLTRMGVEGLRADASAHELDATAAALTGYEFFMGAAEMIGGEHGMLLPLTD